VVGNGFDRQSSGFCPGCGVGLVLGRGSRTHESHTVVTRQIGNLEAHLGARLFQRTTRGLTLTEDGRELLGYSRQMLELAENMESSLGQRRDSPHGLVRLGTFVSEFFVPRIPKLLEHYPGLSLELVMHDHSHDLVEDRLDLAIHGGPITDETSRWDACQ
jgi:DNA-binding transcriptional LysR family regulator